MQTVHAKSGSFSATAHRALNMVLLVGIVGQFWAAGWAVFGQPFTVHAVLGWLLMPVALLSLLAAALAYGWDFRTMWAAGLLLLLALQPVFVFVLSSVSIAVAALHPVNGLAAFCVALFLHLGSPGADAEENGGMTPTRLAVLAILLSGACTERGTADEGWGGTVDTTESGTIVVTNPAVPLSHGDSAWTLREDLRIGSMMGDAATGFGQIGDLHPHPDGGVYVLDTQSRQVRLFAVDGALRRTMGGSGEGPGEFRQPVAIGAAPDGGVRVADMGNSRVTEFDARGEMARTDALPAGVRVWPWLGRFMEDGGVMAPLLRTDGEHARLELVRYDADFRPLDTLATPLFRGDFEASVFELSTGGGLTTVQVPYSPRVVWTIDPSGGFWVVPTTADYVIHRIDFTGDTLLTIVRPHEPLPLSGAEVDSAVAALRWFSDQGGNVERSRFPATKPALTGLFITESGLLAVEPTTAAFGSGWQSPAHVLDVFDRSGRYLARLELPEGTRTESARPAFIGDTVFAVQVDELDVPYVVRYLLRTEGEARGERTE